MMYFIVYLFFCLKKERNIEGTSMDSPDLNWKALKVHYMYICRDSSYMEWSGWNPNPTLSKIIIFTNILYLLGHLNWFNTKTSRAMNNILLQISNIYEYLSISLSICLLIYLLTTEGVTSCKKKKIWVLLETENSKIMIFSVNMWY